MQGTTRGSPLGSRWLQRWRSTKGPASSRRPARTGKHREHHSAEHNGRDQVPFFFFFSAQQFNIDCTPTARHHGDIARLQPEASPWSPALRPSVGQPVRRVWDKIVSPFPRKKFRAKVLFRTVGSATASGPATKNSGRTTGDFSAMHDRLQHHVLPPPPAMERSRGFSCELA
jgi:hypothetical protein